LVKSICGKFINSIALLVLKRGDKIIKSRLGNITLKDVDILYILGQAAETAELAGLCRAD